MRTRSTHSPPENRQDSNSDEQSGNKEREETPKPHMLEEVPVEEGEEPTTMSPNDCRPKAEDCDVTQNVTKDGATGNTFDKLTESQEESLDLEDSENAVDVKDTKAESPKVSDPNISHDGNKGTDSDSESEMSHHETTRSDFPSENSPCAADGKNTEKTTISDGDDKNKDTSSPDKKAESNSVNPFGIFPPFLPNPTSFFTGPLHSEFAKSFYNSLSLLASQAMMNVEQEPKERSKDESALTNQTTSSDGRLQLPPRNDSRNINFSSQSYDGQYRDDAESLLHNRSPALSNGNAMMRRALSELSPEFLAAQLRNNDSASMVVSRQQKFSSRTQGFPRQPYASSGGESPPPVFPPIHVNGSPSRSSDFVGVSHGNMTSSSSSLHHFTTRYTVETLADPSRLGVELVLEHDNDEPVVEVECGGNRGLLYVNKLCQGSKGQSIHFNDEWLTPNEFQFISGRETAKDWKRSIRHCGKSLKTLMTKGILLVHPPVCDCNQCRGFHTGSKLLPGKKTPLKDNNNTIAKRIKSSLPFALASDVNHSEIDDMTRHGLDGGLNSIISQLRKANGFDGSDVGETLDLSAKSHDNNEASSPVLNSRKRSRDESPERRKPKEEASDDQASPVPKRPYSKQEEYRNALDPPPFPASCSFLPPDEQYRRILALMSRSMSPEEQQRQLLALAQNMADPVRMQANFADIPGLADALQASMYDEMSKSKYKASRESSDESGHAYDLSRRFVRKPGDNNSNRRSGYGVTPPERYRKPDRETLTPSRVDSSKYTLDSRNREKHPDHPSRDDIRSWTASRHAAMIDLNSSGTSHNRMPEWAPKMPWSSERNESRGKHPDVKSSPSRNGSHNGIFQDNIALDRVRISKTPVTTLHHRPSDPEPHRRHKPHPGGNHRPYLKHENDGRHTPMLDLQKHAVPMLSLKRPTQDDLFGSTQDRSLGKRLSNNSDQEMKDINENSESISMRQSSSAPPPHFSTPENNRDTRRPTSAQERVHSGISHLPRPNATSPYVTSRRPTSSSAGDIMDVSPYDNFLHRKNKEVQQAFEKMRKWTTDDVCKFLKEIDPNVEEHMQEFRKHEIDGEGLPLLTERHLMEIMDVKLGSALKIVARTRRKLKILPESLSCHHASFFLPLLPKICDNEKPSENGPISSDENKEMKPVQQGEESAVVKNE